MTITGLPFDALVPHPSRSAVLGEVHARPFHPIAAPRRLLHFGFLTDHAAARADREALTAYCERQGLPGPGENAKHHRLSLADMALRWEQHSEFTTYTVEMRGDATTPFSPDPRGLPSLFSGLKAPGPHLLSVDLHLMPASAAVDLETVFDPMSLSAAQVVNGAAVAATDFRAVGDGFVRILVLDRQLDGKAAGALVTRLLEIETYRILALFGLPLAQKLAPSVSGAEQELARISNAMASGEGLEMDNKLLTQLTGLAARSEAEATEAAFRFGASRAYDGIVQQRLQAIKEEPFLAWPTLSSFLSRRMAPAMRTCQMLQDRQADLSRKLTRAANLLRTRVDVEIERQNRDLLQSMNERARMQLRLQQTVEGLSVAAISYYVVSLGAYVFKAMKEVGLLPIDPTVATALFVPVSVLGIALTVRMVRKRFER